MSCRMLQRLICLVLALLMLDAISHHALCAAEVIDCTPCQTADHQGEDHCPACSVSQLMVTTGLAKTKQVLPAAQPTAFPSFDLARLLLIKPIIPAPVVSHAHDPSEIRNGYLRDLRRSIPIRAPSLTA